MSHIVSTKIINIFSAFNFNLNSGDGLNYPALIFLIVGGFFSLSFLTFSIVLLARKKHERTGFDKFLIATDIICIILLIILGIFMALFYFANPIFSVSKLGLVKLFDLTFTLGGLYSILSYLTKIYGLIAFAATLFILSLFLIIIFAKTFKKKKVNKEVKIERAKVIKNPNPIIDYSDSDDDCGEEKNSVISTAKTGQNFTDEFLKLLEEDNIESQINDIVTLARNEVSLSDDIKPYIMNKDSFNVLDFIENDLDENASKQTQLNNDKVINDEEEYYEDDELDEEEYYEDDELDEEELDEEESDNFDEFIGEFKDEDVESEFDLFENEQHGESETVGESIRPNDEKKDFDNHLDFSEALKKTEDKTTNHITYEKAPIFVEDDNQFIKTSEKSVEKEIKKVSDSSSEIRNISLNYMPTKVRTIAIKKPIATLLREEVIKPNANLQEQDDKIAQAQKTQSNISAKTVSTESKPKPKSNKSKSSGKSKSALFAATQKQQANAKKSQSSQKSKTEKDVSEAEVNEKPKIKEVVAEENVLPVTKRYVVINRRNAVNVFNDYLNSKNENQKEDLENKLNTIIMK